MARAHWASRFGFVMVTAGSAVGLGNIWKFPYITGKYGGSAFVLMYLLAIALTGIPVFLAELYIGRTSQRNPVQAFEQLAGRRTPWSAVGWLGLIAGFLILCFYSVVGGWVLHYLWESIQGTFHGFDPEQTKQHLGALMANPGKMIFWHALFMVATVGILLGGVSAGIERCNKIMMPGLILILLALLVRSAFLPGFGAALDFLLKPNFAGLSAEGLLQAMGHSFFTLSLGIGAIITYGSYTKKDQPLVPVALTVVALDTVIALIAGVVTLAAVFSYGGQPEAGPTLMFQTLPNLFAQMPGGYWVSVAFFVLVAFAALTSSISMLEPVIAYWVDRKKGSRTGIALGSGFLAFAIGCVCALSFNKLENWKIGKHIFFDFLDKLTSNLCLPLGGLLIIVFYGWVLGKPAVKATMGGKNRFWTQVLLWCARWITPIAVLAVLINGLRQW
ncbi:sodium-dependent transporter [bacterium]|nr:sodium-dependent transporter [bacterium]